mgnify:CR=1 FL=1
MGWSSHRLRKAVANGEMVCLYPGWFATSTAWQAWFPEERCVAQAIAVARAGNVGDDAVSQWTAGAMLGWPLYGVRPQRTHISGPTRDDNTRGRSLAHHRRPAVTDTIEIAGSRSRVEEWVGAPITELLDDIKINFTSPNGSPGISSVTFEVPGRGLIRV